MNLYTRIRMMDQLPKRFIYHMARAYGRVSPMEATRFMLPLADVFPTQLFPGKESSSPRRNGNTSRVIVGDHVVDRWFLHVGQDRLELYKRILRSPKLSLIAREGRGIYQMTRGMSTLIKWIIRSVACHCCWTGLLSSSQRTCDRRTGDLPALCHAKDLQESRRKWPR